MLQKVHNILEFYTPEYNMDRSRDFSSNFYRSSTSEKKDKKTLKVMYKSLEDVYKQSDDEETLKDIYKVAERMGTDDTMFFGLAQLVYEKLNGRGMSIQGTKMEKSSPYERYIWRKEADTENDLMSSDHLPPDLPGLPLHLQAQIYKTVVQKVPSNFEILKTNQGWVNLDLEERIQTQLNNAFQELSQLSFTRNKTQLEKEIRWKEYNSSTGYLTFFRVKIKRRKDADTTITLNQRSKGVDRTSLIRRTV